MEQLFESHREAGFSYREHLCAQSNVPAANTISFSAVFQIQAVQLKKQPMGINTTD